MFRNFINNLVQQIFNRCLGAVIIVLVHSRMNSSLLPAVTTHRHITGRGSAVYVLNRVLLVMIKVETVRGLNEAEIDPKRLEQDGLVENGSHDNTNLVKSQIASLVLSLVEMMQQYLVCIYCRNEFSTMRELKLLVGTSLFTRPEIIFN